MSETLQINIPLNENNQINLYVIDRLNASDCYFINKSKMINFPCAELLQPKIYINRGPLKRQSCPILIQLQGASSNNGQRWSSR